MTLALCAGNSPVTGEFPSQRTSNEANVSIWWRHHEESLHHIFIHTSWILSWFSSVISQIPRANYRSVQPNWVTALGLPHWVPLGYILRCHMVYWQNGINTLRPKQNIHPLVDESTFSNAFLRMEINGVWFKFSWNLFPIPWSDCQCVIITWNFQTLIVLQKWYKSSTKHLHILRDTRYPHI